MLVLFRPKKGLYTSKESTKDEKPDFPLSGVFNGPSNCINVSISNQLRKFSKKLYKALSCLHPSFPVDWENDSLETIIKRLLIFDFPIKDEGEVLSFNSFLLKRYFPALPTDPYFSSRVFSSFSLLSMTFMSELACSKTIAPILSEEALKSIYAYLCSILCSSFNFGQKVNYHLPILRYFCAVSIGSLLCFCRSTLHGLDAVILGISNLLFEFQDLDLQCDLLDITKELVSLTGNIDVSFPC